MSDICAFQIMLVSFSHLLRTFSPSLAHGICVLGMLANVVINEYK